MRIFITGGHGQLGGSLRRALIAHDVVAPGHEDLDVTDARAVGDAIGSFRPHAVVHAAALTDTARCEREPATARAVNAIGAEHVAQAAQRAGARLVAISTNEVFDGSKLIPYVEDDRTGPLNAYAISKLDGEWLAAATCPDTLIVRTSWLYGENGNSFIRKLRAAASSGGALRFVDDEIAGPTAAEDLALAIQGLIECAAPAAIYHLANSGEASRYEWALEILRLYGMGAVPIERITTAQLRATGYAGPQKPRYSTLANTRAAALGIIMRPWQDALGAYVHRTRAMTDA